MNEFIEKLIGRLEELYNRNDKMKNKAYEEQDWEKFDLFTHRCEGIYSAIEIVNRLAEEYNNGFCEHTLGSGVTSCGHIFPGDSESGKCPYCGKKIKVVE